MVSPIKARASRYIGIYLSVILFIVSFGFGILVGKFWYVKKQISGENGMSSITEVLNLKRNFNKSNSVDFNQFWEVWDMVKTKYVKQPTNEVDMFYGAIQGMVASLNDPYSMYFTPKAADEFAKDLEGELEGIGAEIGIKEGQLLVISPLPDSPAEKSGLRPGDKILFIDKVSTYDMDVSVAVSKIRGKADTSVVITILRESETKERDISIVRSKISVPAILFSMKGDYAHLRVMQFNDDTTSNLNKAIKKIKSSNVNGIILDLRNNPGGYLQSAVEMASEWVEDGIIVSEKGINGAEGVKYETQGKHRLSGLKTVILINKGSASASEIVAGALQDHKKAVVVGEKSYGKGSVQDFEILSDGSALKLTIAEWFTPNGKNINKEGISPDIEVKEDWDKEKIGEDIMIKKAVEVLGAK
ncbi:MAG: S41 family peptidase [Patescibacteria group bacterium]